MFELRESKIHGQGVFAIDEIDPNCIIGDWCSKDAKDSPRYLYNEGMECYWFETPILGRYCNHSLTPNTSVIKTEDRLILLSNGISAGEEILVNYNWVTEHIGYIIDTTGID